MSCVYDVPGAFDCGLYVCLILGCGQVKLAAEREQHLLRKNENGIMRKKFTQQLKEIEDGKDDNKNLMERQKQLYHQIQMLEKEIAGLKKEIRERDETIGDKEKRIYDLKKKNQELEKFKFVLDYKIKELKKQIEPRALEISDMKDQIKEMDRELERSAPRTLTPPTLTLSLDPSTQYFQPTPAQPSDSRDSQPGF